MVAGRYTETYRQARTALFADLAAQGVTAVPCVVCGRFVDLARKGTDPMARSIDHALPLAAGGSLLDRTGWGIAHFGCNARKGARLRRPVKPRPEPEPSREW
jgi:hypothetical protein